MDSRLGSAEAPRVSFASLPHHGFSFSLGEGAANSGTGVGDWNGTAGIGTAITGNSRDSTCAPNTAPTVAEPVPSPALSGGSSSAQVPFQFQIPKHFQFHVPIAISLPSPEQPPLNLSCTNCHVSAPPTHSPSTPRSLHAHRQSHNSSKLPAYRSPHLGRRPVALGSSLPRRHPVQPLPAPTSPAPTTLNNPRQLTETQERNTQQFTSAQAPRQSIETDLIQDPSDRTAPQHHLRSSEDLNAARPRVSTFQSRSLLASATIRTAHVKRSLSFDSTKVYTGAREVPGATDSTATLVQQHDSTSHNPALAQDSEARVDPQPAEATPRDCDSGERELVLPKTLKRTLSDERRPPASSRLPTNHSGPAPTTSVPPIRSFRSSDERRSLFLDMNPRNARNYDGGDNYSDTIHRDRTLRALEGRREDGARHWTPPGSAGERGDGDDSGDLFLQIAREDSPSRTAENKTAYAESPSAISRVARGTRRPVSVAVSSTYRSPSPPHLSRRLSEHESARSSNGSQEQGERSVPPVSYRGHLREPHAEDVKFRGATTPVRASPLTSRVSMYQHPNQDTGTASRRRQRSVDRVSAAPSRMASLKQASVNYSHPRAYNSSPLVGQATEPPKQDLQPIDQTHVEGTDSSTSTAAPSTVWDELEELKSRIHRLELTGKLPSTSSAAISRASDERPPTAHTNATTLSASPKRNDSSALQSTEPSALPKDNHALLHSALAKAKELLAPAVYSALEAATTDALALTTMIGTAGQPGPISSRTSNVESGSSGPAAVTDRQLRKKADGVCRSLTELCLALSEGAAPGVAVANPQQVQQSALSKGETALTSPLVTQFFGVSAQRRPSAPANRAIDAITSPRTVSRFEDKRSVLLSPRYTSNLLHATTEMAAPTPAPPVAGRKTSLLFNRARRAGTEEPEDGRRTSLITRSRRAGTEEPEALSDRKPILTRGRRATLADGEEEHRFRTPSRAVTEVSGTRPREYFTHIPPLPTPKETADTLANSALPRRRLGSAAVNTRLAQPTAVPATPASALATPNRRYFDRFTPGRETANGPEKLPEDRSQAQFSLARSGSLNRRAARQSLIAAPSTSATYSKQ
ncbi:hypothetical protein F5Y17DRAFT_413444 [Xylariaceae sp. FL0594]|nr:hypothetical protein F5Y17DRAFT_413444 [Xylariaceae sp. FL0594]